MVSVLVVITFVVLVALDYFVFSRREGSAAASRAARRGPEPLPALAGPPPEGTFLQPTGTWSRIGEHGEVYVGVHPMLLGLIGSPRDVELLRRGAHVDRGAALARIGRAGRRLTVRSPVSGRVERVYRQAAPQYGWRRAREREGEWLYRLAPDRLADEMGTWLAGEQAVSWMRRRYEELRSFLQAAAADRHLGPVLADGGELPVGILGTMDQGVWDGLEDRFLVLPAAEDRP